MSSVGISVTGITELQAVFRKILEPELTQSIDHANKKAADSLKKDVQLTVAETSVTVSKKVRVHRAKTGKPGWVVGAKRKGLGFVFPFIVGGTRDHGARSANALAFIPNWNPYLGASVPRKRLQGRAGGNKGGLVVIRKPGKVHGIRGTNAVERAAIAGESRAFEAAQQSFLQETRL